MAKESDVALKLLANVHPADWVVFAGLILMTSAAKVTAIDARLRQRLADEPAEARPADVWDATKWLLLARYPQGFSEANMMLAPTDLEHTRAACVTP